jgi:curved DNA-binding protein CbpA
MSSHQESKMYFQNYKTAEDVRKMYHDLARVHHPDVGGSTATMQAINTEYAFAVDRARRNEKPDLQEAEYTTMAAVDEAIRQAIDAIINLDGLDIEICGLWVWVGGNTRANKEEIKAASYKWASKKKKWYFAGVSTRSRGGFTMEEIRDLYGSRKVVRQARRRPAGLGTA